MNEIIKLLREYWRNQWNRRKDRVNASRREKYRKDGNNITAKRYWKEYREKNREKLNAYQRKRYAALVGKPIGDSKPKSFGIVKLAESGGPKSVPSAIKPAMDFIEEEYKNLTPKFKAQEHDEFEGYKCCFCECQSFDTKMSPKVKLYFCKEHYPR